ncbi:MAG: hypothetical protein ACUVUF_07905 [Candidatus Bathycorpusculaceae bacterium]
MSNIEKIGENVEKTIKTSINVALLTTGWLHDSVVRGETMIP